MWWLTNDHSKDYYLKQPALIKEETNDKEEIDKEKMNIVNSKIIKTMKRNRQMKLQDLRNGINEMINGFIVTDPLFDESINYLIENEYIEKNKDDSTLMEYIP